MVAPIGFFGGCYAPAAAARRLGAKFADFPANVTLNHWVFASKPNDWRLILI
jgi:hypothetical protein